VGGAAESGSAIAMARKNKVDLTVGIAMGSSIQIALFVAPALVLASYFIAPQPLELAFSRAEIGTMFLTVLIGAFVAGDGRSNWFKGIQLITVYAMIAILFYFLPGGETLTDSSRLCLMIGPNPRDWSEISAGLRCCSCSSGACLFCGRSPPRCFGRWCCAFRAGRCINGCSSCCGAGATWPRCSWRSG
jgi:hypothetical protein